MSTGTAELTDQDIQRSVLEELQWDGSLQPNDIATNLINVRPRKRPAPEQLTSDI